MGRARLERAGDPLLSQARRRRDGRLDRPARRGRCAPGARRAAARIEWRFDAMSTRIARTTFATGTPWEPVVGYSRAVRVGSMVFVSGTTATGPDGGLVGRGDPGAQTRQVLANLR